MIFNKFIKKVFSLNHLNKKDGFTLLEILLVVGIIAILAGITIVAINPSKQLAQVRNTERKSDLKQVANAITQFYIDKSYYPTSLTGVSTLTEICDTGALPSPSGVDCTDMIDLSELVPTYITAIPKDPSATTTYHAGYRVIKTGNKIGLSATAELGQTITIGNVPTTTESTLGVGLVAHYLMNDTDGTTAVDNIGAHNGTGTYTPDSDGKIGGALSFNGSSNKITLTSESLGISNQATFSVWVKTTQLKANWMAILGKDSDTNGRDYTMQITNGGQYVFYLDGGGEAILYSTIGSSTIGEWQHITLTFNNGTMKWYINGELNNSGIFNTTSFTIGSNPLIIGARTYTGNEDYFYGGIDDVRIYNRVLSQDEITALAAGTEAE